MELKSFIVHWRILSKAFNQRQTNGNKDVKLKRIASASKIVVRSQSPCVKIDKKEVKKQIKKVLVNSIRLKMKLKQQITSLKNKLIIDEKVILENLKLSEV